MRRILTDEKLKALRDYLPQGSNKAIAIKTGLSPAYISKVLHGFYVNVPVIEEALTIALEEKAKKGVFVP